MDTSKAVISEDNNHSCWCCTDIVRQLIRPTIKEVEKPPSLYSVVEDVNLGWLDTLMENQHCSLCRFVTRLYDTIILLNKASMGEPRCICCYIVGIRLRLTKSGKRRAWHFNLRFDDLQGQPSSSIDAAFRLLGQDAHLLGLNERIYNLGRAIKADNCDLGLIKSWYDECRQLHTTACEHPSTTIGGKEISWWARACLPSSMRFIDVEDNCIKHLWPQPDFVALSYVWGGVDMFQLTKANLSSMERPGSLLNVNLPQTIQDAISVTRALGERYLWVDAVCIIQDDEDDKIDQIQQMDKIYSNAALTIIAADADHADAGLPCFRTGSRQQRQVVGEIRGLRFVSAEPNLDRVMKGCAYSSRGWTFQEFALSRRLLIFSPSQVYYSCEADVFSEDFMDRLPPEGDDGILHEDAESEAYLDSRTLNFVGNFPNSYDTAVEWYSQRKLTFEADVRPAVLGVLRPMGETLNERFICGIPTVRIFEQGLLWLPRGPLSRRTNSSIHRPSRFPSWPWIGWIGWIGPVCYLASGSSG